jgi:hypothetical protein
MVASFQNPEAQFEKVGQFIAGFLGNAVNRSDVTKRCDHQMSGCVGKFVEDNKVVAAPKKDVSVAVVVELEGVAENASFHPADSLDIFLSPGSGDIFHYLLTSSLRSLLGLK